MRPAVPTGYLGAPALLTAEENRPLDCRFRAGWARASRSLQEREPMADARCCIAELRAALLCSACSNILVSRLIEHLQTVAPQKCSASRSRQWLSLVRRSS